MKNLLECTIDQLINENKIYYINEPEELLNKIYLN